MEFIDRYNELCKKLGCKKYYIVELNDGDMDCNYQLHAYTSVRECFEDYKWQSGYDPFWDYDEEEDLAKLTFKKWYLEYVNTKKGDVEYRYPTFTKERAFKIIQALISENIVVEIRPTAMYEYDLRVNDLRVNDYYVTCKTLEEALIELLLLLDKEEYKSLFEKVKQIIDNMSVEEEQMLLDRKRRENMNISNWG